MKEFSLAADLRRLEDLIKEQIKSQGFTETLHQLKRAKVTQGSMCTVTGGVLERLPSGGVDAALETDEGPVLIRGGQRSDQQSTDLQLTGYNAEVSSTGTAEEESIRPADLLERFQLAGTGASPNIIFAIELTSFASGQRDELLPLLWRYILHNRVSEDRENLVAIGAAIRKYIALMPMERMEDLSLLLAPGNHEPLNLKLELEVVKMVYRNFEVHPPCDEDTLPSLGEQLWNRVVAYTNPLILLRDKHSAVASLSIEALVAMRSSRAAEAWKIALRSCKWFGEMVTRDLMVLRERWAQRNEEAATWLDALRAEISVSIRGTSNAEQPRQ